MNSLPEMLCQFANVLQRRLFPALEEELGELTEPHSALVQAIALLQIDAFVVVRSGRGRPAHSRSNILRAFVAKAVFNLPHTRALLERLRSDIRLCRLCGWKAASELPDETVFSRAFRDFANSQLPQ